MKIPLFLLAILAAAFLIALAIAVMLQLLKGKRFKKGEHYIVKKKGFFYRLFVMAPRQYAIDLMDRDPEYFRHQGCVVFTGRQGMGKTIAMVEQTMRFQQEYPKCKVISNCAYAHQDDELKHWRQLLTYKNDIQGVVVQIDEMQNWFSSNQSKNFLLRCWRLFARTERIGALFWAHLRYLPGSASLCVSKQRKSDAAAHFSV